MEEELLRKIDTAYRRLEEKRAQVVCALKAAGLETASGWYNGHLHRDEKKEWVEEAYPIPVVSARALCDVEIHFDGITVTAKRTREEALTDSLEAFAKESFEVYGVEDDRTDFCHPGQMREKICTSGEREFFSPLPFRLNAKKKKSRISLCISAAGAFMMESSR